jgi:Domain of unknown function (DUF4340)
MRTHRPALLLALSLLLAAFAAGVWSRSSTDTSAEPTPEVLTLGSSDVRHVSVESGGTKTAFARNPDGSWSGEAGAPSQATTLLSDAETRLFPLRAYRTLDVDADQPEFGLASPEMTLTVDDTAGTTHRILLGAATFTGGGVYARRADDPRRLFLVPHRTMDDLRSVLAGKALSATNDVPHKLRELKEKQAAADADQASWWLRQVLDSDAQLPEGAK